MGEEEYNLEGENVTMVGLTDTKTSIVKIVLDTELAKHIKLISQHLTRSLNLAQFNFF